MSGGTACRTLNEDLNFHPYKMTMFQATNDLDTVKSKNYL